MRATVSTTTVWYHPANSLIEDDDGGSGRGASIEYVILNVDRSDPEHAVHSTGSVGGGGQRGTGHGGPKGRFRTRRRSYSDRIGVGGGKELTLSKSRGESGQSRQQLDSSKHQEQGWARLATLKISQRLAPMCNDANHLFNHPRWHSALIIRLFSPDPPAGSSAARAPRRWHT